jgi:hypothetical protein
VLGFTHTTVTYSCCTPAAAAAVPQLPSFNDLRLVSLLGALMSLAYCSIAIAMSATVQPAGVSYSPTAGQRSSTAHVMGVFNALTTVFFAYGEASSRHSCRTCVLLLLLLLLCGTAGGHNVALGQVYPMGSRPHS